MTLSKRLPRAVLSFAVCALFILPLLGLVKTSAETQGIAQGYNTRDDLLRTGMAVQLSVQDSQNGDYVERGTLQNPVRIIGIATTPTSNFAVIGSNKNRVYVQTTGQVVAYVADIGGVVKKGDILTISPLKGILMKANDASLAEVATALEDANLQTAEQVSIDSGSTSTKTAKVSKVLVSLDHQTSFASPNNSNTLSRISRAVVGKDVGELRVIVSLLVFALLLVVEGGIVYGAISSSLTSLGRNPMAGKAIKRELARVLAIAVVILLSGLGVVYVILWV